MSSIWPLKDGDPVKLGFSQERLERIDRLIDGYLEKQWSAGALAVVARYGQLAYCKCFGMRDREAGKPMTDDTIFRMFSMTKPITAVAVLMLYEENKYFLDDPVGRYLPVFNKVKVKVKQPDGNTTLVDPIRPVTIHDLLTHTGGVTYEGLHKAAQTGLSLADFVAQYDTIPLASQPGTQWIYGASNDVLGYLVEVVSGRPYDEFLRERLFSPWACTIRDSVCRKRNATGSAKYTRMMRTGSWYPRGTCAEITTNALSFPRAVADWWVPPRTICGSARCC
jgi:CubicO group peptidase (beta-lactamase class C family)